ncbi:MAG: ATP-binding protein [Campylobacterota bacterium]
MLRIHQVFLRTFILIFIAILITLSILTYFWSKNIYLDQIEKNLIRNINTFSIVLKDLNNINRIIKDLRSQINLRITIVDEKGNVLAESDDDIKTMSNHGNRPEIIQANKSSFGKSIRYSQTVNTELLYVAKKVTISKKIYYIRMADYTDNITRNFFYLAGQIFAFIIFFIIIGFLASYFISLKIKDETEAILDFLTELSSKKPTVALSSNFTLEFYKITKILNKVAIKLKKREKQKAKQNAKLKVANKQKDEIISALSHEFKNPIAVISGYSETILSDNNMPIGIRNKFLNKIHSNSIKMSSIIDKLRLTIKLEEGKQELALISTSMKNLIENIASDLQDNYKDRQINITGEDVDLKVDSTLISMAISNLIENALKYSDGAIIVNISKDTIEIIDNGIGIEAKDLEKIKNKFYRVSKNGWNNSLGLGLFIVHSILLLHSFELDIESEYNKGSKFIIKF